VSSRRPPSPVAVVGAGTMGAGIALAFAARGSEVRLTARREESLERARRRIERSLELLTESGSVGAGGAEGVHSRLATTTSLSDAVRGASLVVESIPERLQNKQRLLAAVEELAPQDAVLATDTSSLSIDSLASGLERPERFAGLHWFNPPEFVELVEVVSGSATSEQVAAALVDWARAIGKTVVHVRRDVPGFVANRLQYALLRESFALVAAGACSYEDIDDAVKAGLGARWAAVGPIESMDLAGLDVHLAVAERLFPELARGSEPAPQVVDLVRAGALGCKTGRGLHGSYEPAAVDGLVRRRDRLLVGIAALRRAAP
jgi:3-hydroxybutyryl-CoA dehydrogenase